MGPYSHQQQRIQPSSQRQGRAHVFNPVWAAQGHSEEVGLEQALEEVVATQYLEVSSNDVERLGFCRNTTRDVACVVAHLANGTIQKK